jgi:hypothetical protein
LNLEEALRRFDLKKWAKRHRFKAAGYGKEYLHDCPFCGAGDKFSISPARRKWRCFVCHIPCTPVDVIAAFEGSRSRAHEVIAQGVGHRAGGLQYIPEFDADDEDQLHRPPGWEPVPMAPPDNFVPLTTHLPYTAARGMSLEHMQILGAGYCTWGRFQDRLVFPVRRYPDGAWLYYQARAMWEKHEHVAQPYRRRDGTLAEDKYQKNRNPFSDDTGKHANANDVLLGLEIAVAYGIKHIALVEGPTDWVAVGPGAVASFGKNLSPRQTQLLVRAGVEAIDFMWDPDAWDLPVHKLADGTVKLTGKPSPAQATVDLLSTTFDMRIVHYPRGFDPGAYSPAVNAQWRATGRPVSQGRLAFIP